MQTDKILHVLQQRLPLREGFQVMVDAIEYPYDVPKVVTWKEIAEDQHLPESVEVVFNQGQDDERTYPVPVREYIINLPDSDLDTICICIINSREGRTIPRPSVYCQSFSLVTKAA